MRIVELHKKVEKSLSVIEHTFTAFNHDFMYSCKAIDTIGRNLSKIFQNVTEEEKISITKRHKNVRRAIENYESQLKRLEEGANILKTLEDSLKTDQIQDTQKLESIQRSVEGIFNEIVSQSASVRMVFNGDYKENSFKELETDVTALKAILKSVGTRIEEMENSRINKIFPLLSALLPLLLITTLDFELMEQMIQQAGWVFFGTKEFICPGINQDDLLFYDRHHHLPPLCVSCYKALIFWGDNFSEENIDNFFTMLSSFHSPYRGKLNNEVVIFYHRTKPEMDQFLEKLKQSMADYHVIGEIQWRRACEEYQQRNPKLWKNAKTFIPDSR